MLLNEYKEILAERLRKVEEIEKEAEALLKRLGLLPLFERAIEEKDGFKRDLILMDGVADLTIDNTVTVASLSRLIDRCVELNETVKGVPSSSKASITGSALYTLLWEVKSVLRQQKS